MALKFTTFLTEFTDACQREDLKTTRVGQYRTIPSIELMQSAGLTKDVESRTKIEMIGIAKDNLSLHLFTQFCEMDSFYTPHRSDGHKDRRHDLTVIGLYKTGSRITIWIRMLYLKRHFFDSPYFFSPSSGIVKSSG